VACPTCSVPAFAVDCLASGDTTALGPMAHVALMCSSSPAATSVLALCTAGSDSSALVPLGGEAAVPQHLQVRGMIVSS
jgi:hypothetical protein